MIRTVLPAALPAALVAFALAAPATAQAQMTQPPIPPAQNPAMSSASVPAGTPPQQMGTEPIEQGYAAPMPGQMPAYYAQPISPRTTWIPSHYNWDPNTSNYVLTEGHYAEAPTETAQWIPGHWAQTPTSWIWIEGGWH